MVVKSEEASSFAVYKGMGSLPCPHLKKMSEEDVEVSYILSIQDTCKFLVHSSLSCSHLTVGI